MYELLALFSFTGILFFAGLAIFRLIAGKKITKYNSVVRYGRISLFVQHIIFSILAFLVFSFAVFKIINS